MRAATIKELYNLSFKIHEDEATMRSKITIQIFSLLHGCESNGSSKVSVRRSSRDDQLHARSTLHLCFIQSLVAESARMQVPSLVISYHGIVAVLIYSREGGPRRDCGL